MFDAHAMSDAEAFAPQRGQVHLDRRFCELPWLKLPAIARSLRDPGHDLAYRAQIRLNGPLVAATTRYWLP